MFFLATHFIWFYVDLTVDLLYVMRIYSFISEKVDRPQHFNMGKIKTRIKIVA